MVSFLGFENFQKLLFRNNNVPPKKMPAWLDTDTSSPGGVFDESGNFTDSNRDLDQNGSMSRENDSISDIGSKKSEMSQSEMSQSETQSPAPDGLKDSPRPSGDGMGPRPDQKSPVESPVSTDRDPVLKDRVLRIVTK